MRTSLSMMRGASRAESDSVAEAAGGWLCNYVPYYEKTYAVKTRVHPREGGDRPCVAIEKTDHPLSVDFHTASASVEHRQLPRRQCIANKPYMDSFCK